MPQSFRERVDTASSIKSILDCYPLGNGLLRELLQNSDDAGATSQTFILDTRQYGVVKLLDPTLKETQGPSLLAVNDSIFNESDWKALQTIHGSNKTSDETKIGKYGLGFRSCYHVTDNPHILSGNTLVIFDPHDEFQSPNDGGMRIDFVAEGDEYPDQLSAFKAAVSNTSEFYQGTVVRLPLRTSLQASRSKIKPKAVPVSEIRSLFSEMVDKELAVVGLFLKSITSIELRVITPDNRKLLIGQVKIEDTSGPTGSRSFARGSGAREATFRCRVTASSGSLVSTTWRIYHSVLDSGITSQIMSKRLPSHTNVGDLLKNDKLFSHIGLAFPLNAPPLRGRLFTLLPLPVYTDFPVHLHGILALTQDRQSLRNKEETGMSPDSREKLLVEWNLAIFDTFIPRAWPKMLRILIDEDNCNDIWSAWPPSSPPDLYWGNLTRNMLKEVIASGYDVFPTIPCRTIPSYVPLASSLVASSSDDPSVLKALALAGISIVQPPDYIFQLLKPMNCRHLNPENVHESLLNRLALLDLLDADDKGVVLNYLAISSSPNVDNIFGLPLIPLFNGGYFTLEKRQPVPIRSYVLASAMENDLYKECDNEMIALPLMCTEVQQLLSDPETIRLANVTPLDKDHVNEHLHRIFGRYNPALDEVDQPEARARVNWLVRFWTWMDSLSGGAFFLPTIERFHLLPTAAGTLRKVQSRILLPTDVSREDIAALNQIGARFLHPSVTVSSSSFLVSQAIGERADDIGSVLRHISPNPPTVTSGVALKLQQYFLRCLQIRKVPSISIELLHVFRQLPIFPTLVPNPDSGEVNTVTAPALGELVFVKAEDCPLPRRPTITYVDVSMRAALALVIDRKAVKNAFDEVKILQSAIPLLENQPLPLLDSLISRIIPRVFGLSKQSQRELQNSRFVPAKGSSDRFTPNKLIDPSSELEKLYLGEPGKFPDPPFNNGPWLSVMQSPGFFQKSLTPDLVLERIKYISTTPNSWSKAELFLKMLDKYWGTSLSLPLPLDDAWLPVAEKGVLCRADQCRDNKDRYLFDFVLRVMNIKLTSSELRASLGWAQDIPFHVLRSQFQSTLNRKSLSKRGDRLMFLIKYMASLHAKGNMSSNDIENLKHDIDKLNIENIDWIPVSSDEFVSTRHAVLSAEFKDVGPFRKLPLSLLKLSELVNFLSCIGCTERPTLDNMLYELERLSGPVTESSVLIALQLLEQMALQLGGNITDSQRERIFVPDREGVMKQIDEIYYDDLNVSETTRRPVSGTPAHPHLSKSLASRITLQFSSSLALDEGDDDDDDDDVDDIDMGEDLCTRIASVLKDHDISYALNEFLANAADAKASQFSVLLDKRSFESSTVLSPEMVQFQQGPSLILHNDAIFSKEDFSGLRKVGQGGKSAEYDTIGRFGLGALSLFHFTEVPMLISGRYVMMLDPSGMYLPPRKGRRRTALYRKISSLALKYPDQISVFESLFRFSVSEAEYNGTLFRLPLRTASSVLSAVAMTESLCLNLLKEPYLQLACDAFYFTCLKTISAEYRSTQNPSSQILWSVSAERTAVSSTDDFDHHQLCLSRRDSDGSVTKDKWLITGCATPLASVPKEHYGVLERHRFTRTSVGITVKLALRLDHASSHSKREHFLFSALRLPVPTSLPVHLHAQFSLAPDRRTIRFDPPDGLGNRVPESAYNAWILSEIVPPLYMFALYTTSISLRASKYSDNTLWWPTTKDDHISGEVVNAFYRLLPLTHRAMCNTITQELIPPQQGAFSLKEPLAIQRLLMGLKPANYVRLPSKVANLARDCALPTVTAEFLRTTIQDHLAEFLRLYEKERVNIHDIESIIHFLLDDDVSPLGLPLLPLSDGTLKTLADARCQIVYHSDGNFSHIFAASRFIHRSLKPKTVERLISDNKIGVKKFDSEGVLSLLRESIQPASRCIFSEEKAGWIDSFWGFFDYLPGPSNPNSLAALPLLRLFRGREYVSLDLCRQGCLVSSTDLTIELAGIAIKLGILVIRTPPRIFSDLLKNKVFSLKAFLECLNHENSSLEALSLHERYQVANWIGSQSHTQLSNLSPTLKATAARLPLWSAKKGSDIQLLPAEDITMLPLGIPRDVISKFLGSGVAVAMYSTALDSFLSNVADRQRMHSSALIGRLRLPTVLHANELADFRALLDIMFRLPSQSLMVPDGNLRLTPASELYDHSIGLISSALQSREATSFVHINLRDLQPRLRNYGLKYEVTFDVFLECARAIDQAHNNDDTSDAAERAYNCYNSQLPSQIMTNTSRWRMLDSLRFIPRLTGRRPRLEELYEVTMYCKELPAIAAPRDLLLGEFEAVAWTQRGIFREQPRADLIAVNPSLGRPRAEEVVAHLLVLSGEISSRHRQSSRLLQDIHATYRWLNTHAVEARPALLLHENDPIFLNLPLNNLDLLQTWVWKSARQLVFNISYDTNDLAAVQGFLTPFRSLLLAAGVEMLSDATYETRPSGQQNDFSSLRTAFNSMREAGELTDVTLMPTEGSCEGEIEKLKAHKCFLAAAVPHLRDGFLSGMTESMSGEYRFEGSEFGARAVLEFLYTGRLKIAKPLSSEDATALLYDLLDLLTTADVWDLQDLKSEVGWVIASEHKLIGPDTYQMVLEKAVECNATDLAESCRKYEDINRAVLSNLTREESI